MYLLNLFRYISFNFLIFLQLSAKIWAEPCFILLKLRSAKYVGYYTTVENSIVPKINEKFLYLLVVEFFKCHYIILMIEYARYENYTKERFFFVFVRATLEKSIGKFFVKNVLGEGRILNLLFFFDHWLLVYTFPLKSFRRKKKKGRKKKWK